MAEAGWYDDPMVPGGKRFWDGARWTEHAQAPPAAAPGNPGVAAAAGQAGPPPFDPTMAYRGTAGGPNTALAAPSYRATTGLNEIGDWLGRTFSVVGSNIVPLLLLLLPHLILIAMAYLLFDQSLRGAAVLDDSGQFIGVDSGLLWAAGALFALSVLVAFVTNLGVHHNLYAAHVGQKASAGTSFFAGLRALPRYVGVLIMLYVAFLAAAAVVVAIGAGLAVLLGDDAVGLLVAFAILGYVGLVVAMVWLSVKLSFITVGAVVIPRGTSVIRTSWNVTTGWFWAIFGRQLLLSLLLSMIFMAAYLVLYFSTVAFIVTRGLSIADESNETLNVIELADILPNPVVTVAVVGLFSAAIYLIQTVGYSGTVALYADLGGANTFGHRRPGLANRR
jgi:hypothetical protein